MIRPHLVPLLLLTACVIDRGDWIRERNQVVCRIQVDCLGTHPDRAACRAAQEADTEPPCSGFRLGAATACLRQLRVQARTCPVDDIAQWRVPTACADVCDPIDTPEDDSGT